MPGCTAHQDPNLAAEVPDTSVVTARLDGLFAFAQGLLSIRTPPQMVMDAGLGVYREAEVAKLPGVSLDYDDGAWLRLERLTETFPAAPESHVAEFLDDEGRDPRHPPTLKESLLIERSIEEASDFCELGLLRRENILPTEESGLGDPNRRVILLLREDCRELVADFEAWRDGAWAGWAATERPRRASIALYRSLFTLHQAMHASDTMPPELVWGIGLARWRSPAGLIDMPILRQLVEIEIESGGTLAIRPRDIAPTLSLEPFLAVEVSGSAALQASLEEALRMVLQGVEPLTPFAPSGWKHLLSAAADRLTDRARYIPRSEIDAGAQVPPIGPELVVSSSWAIHARPRSTAAREQDLRALRAAMRDAGGRPRP